MHWIIFWIFTMPIWLIILNMFSYHIINDNMRPCFECDSLLSTRPLLSSVWNRRKDHKAVALTIWNLPINVGRALTLFPLFEWRGKLSIIELQPKENVRGQTSSIEVCVLVNQRSRRLLRFKAPNEGQGILSLAVARCDGISWNKAQSMGAVEEHKEIRFFTAFGSSVDQNQIRLGRRWLLWKIRSPPIHPKDL